MPFFYTLFNPSSIWRLPAFACFLPCASRGTGPLAGLYPIHSLAHKKPPTSLSATSHLRFDALHPQTRLTIRCVRETGTGPQAVQSPESKTIRKNMAEVIKNSFIYATIICTHRKLKFYAIHNTPGVLARICSSGCSPGSLGRRSEWHH